MAPAARLENFEKKLRLWRLPSAKGTPLRNCKGSAGLRLACHRHVKPLRVGGIPTRQLQARCCDEEDNDRDHHGHSADSVRCDAGVKHGIGEY